MNQTDNRKLIYPLIQWMIRRDMPSVLAIENECFEFPWSEEEFIRCLRQRNCIGMVAKLPDEQIIGYMVYLLEPKRLDVLSLAVDPAFQRRGVGRAMIEKLMGKLSEQRRNRLTVMVRESNLNAQLFCRAVGMQCKEIVREAYSANDEDGYLFTKRVRGE